jgi:hypothetical protein
MRKLAVMIALAAACAGSANARPKHWYTDKKWWIGEAINVGATMADADSTCRAVRRGAVEQNIILGPSPGCGHVFALEIGAAGYWTCLHILDWHLWDSNDPDPHLGLRVLGYTVIPVAAAAINGSAAIQNYGVPAPAPPNTSIGTAIGLRRQEEIRSEFNWRVGEGLVK